jgi:hypothetical protein
MMNKVNFPLKGQLSYMMNNVNLPLKGQLCYMMNKVPSTSHAFNLLERSEGTWALISILVLMKFFLNFLQILAGEQVVVIIFIYQ